MTIKILQVGNNKKHFEIHSPEELTEQIANSLNKKVPLEIKQILPRAFGNSTQPASDDRPVEEYEYTGLIEGIIVEGTKNASEIAAMISFYFDHTMESDSPEHTEWILYSKEEIDNRS